MADLSEKQWVAQIVPQLSTALLNLSFEGVVAKADTGRRLPYAHEILGYDNEDGAASVTYTARYETDILIYDELPEQKGWVPRVVVECKLGAVTTHDALTYSTKAATHKHVHPYLRYGILIGGYGAALPARLARHGAYFDFMAVWHATRPQEGEWCDLLDVLVDEVRASRKLQRFLTSKGHGKTSYRLLHRPLKLKT